MAGTIDSVELAAMELPPDQRLTLAHRLLVSVDSEDSDDISPEWDAEIRRRIAEFDAGKIKGIPAEEVFAELKRLRGK